MAEYSYDDVNFIGGAERVTNAIGKECYYGFSAKQVLENAQDGRYESILKWVDNDSYKPFGDAHDGWYPFMIVKQEPEPNYVPFSNMEEFADAYETNAQGYDPGTFIDNLRCNGMWIRCKKDHGVYQVISMLDNSVMIAGFKDKKTWKELFDEFEFLNNKPCGKEEG